MQQPALLIVISVLESVMQDFIHIETTTGAFS